MVAALDSRLHGRRIPAVAVEVRAEEDAVEFGVHVSTRSSRPGVGGEHGGRLRARVSSAPEDGKANKELIALVARALGAKKSEVEIVSGRTSRDKLVRVACAEPGGPSSVAALLRRVKLAATVMSLGGE